MEHKFVIPTYNTSKNEEIDIMGALVEAVNGEKIVNGVEFSVVDKPILSYLSALLTLDLFKWYADRIKDDASTDLYAEYKLRGEDLAGAVQRLQSTEEAYDKAEAMIERARQHIAELEEEAKQDKKRILDLTAKTNSMVPGDYLRQSQDELREVRKERDRLEASNLKLKAKLFDLMIGED